MNSKKSRRFVLKVLSSSPIISSEYFVEKARSRGSDRNVITRPSPDNLQVINNGKSGQELGVRLIPIKKSKSDNRKEINKKFEVYPASKELGPPVASGDADLGGGEYRVVLTGPSGHLGSRKIKFGPDGIPDHGSLIVFRTPDNSARINYLLY